MHQPVRQGECEGHCRNILHPLAQAFGAGWAGMTPGLQTLLPAQRLTLAASQVQVAEVLIEVLVVLVANPSRVWRMVQITTGVVVQGLRAHMTPGSPPARRPLPPSHGGQAGASRGLQRPSSQTG
jgi:hypothetical protein